MYDVKACRGCLSTNGNLEKLNNITKKIYSAVTGIAVTELDGLPSYLCAECQGNIKKALVFRRRCRRAYYVMKEIMSLKKQVTLNDIMMVSRKKTNLASPYAISKPQNTTYFAIAPKVPDVDTLIETIDKYQPEDTPTELFREEIDKESSIFHIDIPPQMYNSEFNYTTSLQTKVENKEEVPDEPVDADDANDADNDFEMPDFTEDTEEVSKEEEAETEEEEKEEEKEQEVVEKEEAPKKTRINVTKSINDTSDALANCHISVLTLKQQKDAFNELLQEPTFRTAMYKCALCVVVMLDLEELLKHVKKHNAGILYQFTCDVCKIKFKSQEGLIIHTAHMHLYEYKCKDCDFKTSDLKVITAHHQKMHVKAPKKHNSKLQKLEKNFTIRSCKPEMMYYKRSNPISKRNCRICNQKFVTIHTLSTHMNKHKRPDTSTFVQCDVCGVYYKNTVTLAYHMEMWHAYTYQCKTCKEFLFNAYEAQHHFNRRHAASSRDLVCEFCDRKMKSELGLQQHIAYSHYSQIYIEHCNLCGESFKSLRMLYQHQLFTHKYISINYPWKGNEDFHCTPCKTTFLSLKSYRNHALRHGHDDAKEFENTCFPCKQIFDTSEEYQTHLKESCKDTTTKYPRKCPYCDEVVSNMQKYMWHHKREHSDMPPDSTNDYKLCELCGETVIHMKEHLRRHTHQGLLCELDSYSCSYCYPARQIRGAARYASHVVRAHTARPYCCALCPHKYRWLSDCRDHILMEHAPVTPYECGVCSEKFSHEDFVMEHALKVHDTVVKIPRKDPKYSIKIKVYPHMKVNMTLVDPSVLSSMTFEMLDYVNKDIKVVENIEDYVILDHPDLGNNKFNTNPRKKRKIDEALNMSDLLRKLGTQDSKHTCAFCFPAREFNDVSRYASHVVRIHTSRPYLCALCPKKYKWMSNCRDHILMEHGPVKPYECGLCSEKFSHGDFMKDHATKVHNSEVVIPRLDAKAQFKLRVYPHMKLNVSLLDPSSLKSINLELTDYLHQTSEVIEDIKDYVVIDKPELSIAKRGGRKGVKREKIDKIVKEENEVQENIEQFEVIEHDGDQYINIEGVIYKLENDSSVSNISETVS